MKFPEHIIKDLNKRPLTFPSGMEGQLNLVMVGYEQWQQAQFDSWFPFAAQLAARYPGFQYYEMPVISRLNRLARFVVDEGMRGGIPDRSVRARVFTLYTDIAAFNRQLEIETTRKITLMLVRTDGSLVWRESGAWTAGKGESLEQAVQAQLGLNQPE